MEWTPTQRRILDVLSDGRGHPKKELLKCLDAHTCPEVLAVHITLIRKKLLKIGQNILSVNSGTHGFLYMHVRLLASGDE